MGDGKERTDKEEAKGLTYKETKRILTNIIEIVRREPEGVKKDKWTEV